MTIITDKGIKINLTETPHWNDFYKRFYAYGFRWIKTKETFSTVSVLHNFESYTEAGE